MKNRWNILILMTLFCLFCTAKLQAAKPLGFMSGFLGGEKVEADPTKLYTLNDLNGPWMICAATFSGDDAKERAMELAFELRKSYKIKAYVHERVFDHTKNIDGAELEALKSAPDAPYRKKIAGGNVTRDWAVLVGDFQSIDDNDINEMLKKLKSGAISPKCLSRKSASDGDKTGSSEVLKKTREEYRKMANEEFGYNVSTSPLASASKTPNPVLPKEFFVQQKGFMDDFEVKMNEYSAYSILKCRGKFTIMVAKFTGAVSINASEISSIEKGNKELGNKLDRAGEDAEHLAEALRIKGWSAFTYHSRNASIVSIGEFNYLGNPLPNGMVNYTDDIAKIFKTFSGTASGKSHLEANETAFVVQSIVGIPLLPQPQPIETPKPRPKQARK